MQTGGGNLPPISVVRARRVSNTCQYTADPVNAANRPPDYRDHNDGLLHNYWSKLFLIIRPVSMAAAATEKAAAAAAARRLKN